MNKVLTIISICIERGINKVISFLYFLILKLRGLQGGWGVNITFNSVIKGWLCNVYLGKNVVFHNGVRLIISRNSKLILKDRAWVSAYTSIITMPNTKIEIGKNTMFGPNCILVSADHNINDKLSLRDSGHTVGDILIEDNCWIGANTVITKGITIGQGAIIGACSVVTKDIPAMSVAVGQPAKVIKRRCINKKL